MVVRAPSMSAGLDASTVTPGSTAPDASRTRPAIALCANADGAKAAKMAANRAERTCWRIVSPPGEPVYFRAMQTLLRAFTLALPIAVPIGAVGSAPSIPDSGKVALARFLAASVDRGDVPAAAGGGVQPRPAPHVGTGWQADAA